MISHIVFSFWLLNVQKYQVYHGIPLWNPLRPHSMDQVMDSIPNYVPMTWIEYTRETLRRH